MAPERAPDSFVDASEQWEKVSKPIRLPTTMLNPVPQTGEEQHESGRIGVRDAKRWLEATCRAEVKWDNPNSGKSKLQFVKAGATPSGTAQGDTFSFDCGGTLLGGTSDGEIFLAEVKHYGRSGNQGEQYREFLAKCYQAKQIAGPFCDHFLWITWAPFSVTTWSNLLTPDYVHAAVLATERSRKIALGNLAEPDPGVCDIVSGQLTVVVISDRQLELLSLQAAELIPVRKALIRDSYA